MLILSLLTINKAIPTSIFPVHSEQFVPRACESVLDLLAECKEASDDFRGERGREKADGPKKEQPNSYLQYHVISE